MLNRRQFLALGGAALASGAGLGLYTWQVEPHWVEVVRRPLPLAYLPPALEGRTLLQLSDLHVGPQVDSSYLIRALTEASALGPDFVAFTGDFVSYRSAHEYAELARVLRALPRGRLATVAALGNHDYGFGWRQLDVAHQVARVASDAGAVVLRNEVRALGGIQFAGLGDLWSPEFDAGAAALRDVRQGVPTIVLAHNPDMQDLPIWNDVRGWVLAGHTHGGQVKPPFLPPPVLPVRNKRYTAGEFHVGDGRRMYINRGLGHLLQVRFNVRPEMTLFTLTRGAC
ncbi:MAG TPA: metallophosphoesterase [Gemmatimonadaceae bacterium]|nr:metallophosphoesterase [Gemmatimonadaceae bacterium]